MMTYQIKNTVCKTYIACVSACSSLLRKYSKILNLRSFYILKEWV